MFDISEESIGREGKEGRKGRREEGKEGGKEVLGGVHRKRTKEKGRL